MKRLLIMPLLAFPLVGCSAPNCSGTDVLAFVRKIIHENLANNLDGKYKYKYTVNVEQVMTVERTRKRISCRALLIIHDGHISREKQFIYIVKLNDDGTLYGNVYVPD